MYRLHNRKAHTKQAGPPCFPVHLQQFCRGGKFGSWYRVECSEVTTVVLTARDVLSEIWKGFHSGNPKVPAHIPSTHRIKSVIPILEQLHWTGIICDLTVVKMVKTLWKKLHFKDTFLDLEHLVRNYVYISTEPCTLLYTVEICYQLQTEQM
jgi:hypothetical protein